MKQITDRDGNPNVFDLDLDGDQPTLYGRYIKPGSRWHSLSKFVFRYRKLKT